MAEFAVGSESREQDSPHNISSGISSPSAGSATPVSSDVEELTPNQLKSTQSSKEQLSTATTTCERKSDPVFDVDDDELCWPSPPPSAYGIGEDSNVNDVLQTVCTSALENFDIILQRTSRERSSELNELQNTARPVTGTNARENISEFLSRATNPSTHSNNDQRRPLPEDVQNLMRRSIVTSALRRYGFRSALEQSLAARLAPAVPSDANSVPGGIHNIVRSVSGTSTPSVFTRDGDTASVISESTTDSDAVSEIQELQRVLDAGVQVLSETIEEDLAELHHLHVVSSVLGGDFRDNLESIFQERARNIGGGEVVERFIRSLPGSNGQHQRASAPFNITQRSSRSMIQSQHVNLPAELNSLKQQMEDMKRILQMTFEMQMETQRSIKQEVSAVFGAFMEQFGQGAHATSSQQVRVSEGHRNPVSAGSCVICFDKQVDTVLYQCGHMCVCHMCGLQLKMNGQRCPMCRAPIRDAIRAYQTQ